MKNIALRAGALLLWLGISVTAAIAHASGSLGALSLTASFDARLIEQQAHFHLAHTGYSAEIQYVLQSSRADAVLQGEWVWPFLCRGVITESQSCVQEVEIRVDDQLLSAEQIKVLTVASEGYLLAESSNFQKLMARMNAQTASAQSQTDGSLSNVTLQLYQFSISAAGAAATAAQRRISIKFSAPYYSNEYRAGEVAASGFSHDALFYSFAAGAKWTQGKLDRFKVTLDVQALYGDIGFVAGPAWDLREGVYVYEKKSVDLASILPLMMVLDQRAEKQYRYFVSMQAQAVRGMQLQLLGETPESVAVLHDADLKTVWCQSGRTARLQLTLAKPDVGSLCQFEGIALVSGNTESATKLRANSRLKSVLARFSGTERFSQERKTVTFEQKAILQDTPQTRFWNPYAATRYFSRHHVNITASKPLLDIVGKTGQDVELDANEAIAVTLELLDIYSGQTENVCVAEVLPLFVCH